MNPSRDMLTSGKRLDHLGDKALFLHVDERFELYRGRKRCKGREDFRVRGGFEGVGNGVYNHRFIRGRWVNQIGKSAVSTQ